MHHTGRNIHKILPPAGIVIIILFTLLSGACRSGKQQAGDSPGTDPAERLQEASAEKQATGNKGETGLLPGIDFPFYKLKQPVPPHSELKEENYDTWGGSMIRSDDGRYHLYYSRWPKEGGHISWVVNSEVAHAVADDPLGPYTFKEVALPARGKEYWDGMMTHNPTVHKFGDTYYLYYIGTRGDGKPYYTKTNEQGKTVRSINYSHRNNQRIGVAVAEDAGGPWKRFDEPLIDVSPDSLANDNLIVVNPSVARRPDGKYVLVYKAATKDYSKESLAGPVIHRVALADDPAGPFEKQPGVLFDAEEEFFPAEDPYIWYQGDRFLAIVKDMKGAFTDAGRALVLFESEDGTEWSLAPHPLASRRQVTHSDGSVTEFRRLERPQIWFSNGKPAVLFVAVLKGNESYNIHIPLETDYTTFR